MAGSPWLDYGSFSLGFVGVAIASWQLRNARSAREAEAEARQELLAVMIQERLMRFSGRVSLFQEALEGQSSEVRNHVSDLIPALGELKEFSGNILVAFEIERINRDKKALSDFYLRLLEDESPPSIWTSGKGIGVYLQDTLKTIYGRIERERISQVSSAKRVKR